MSTRINQGRVSAEQAARIVKQNKNKRHFEDFVLASVTPTIPMRVADSVDSDEEAILAYLVDSNGKARDDDYVPDYEIYGGNGFNGEVVQSVRFDTIDEEGEKKKTYRNLGVADGEDTGLIFNNALDARGRTVWVNNVVQPAKDPIGRWTLKRSPLEEAEVPRYKDHFFTEIGGEPVEVDKGKVFGIDAGNPYVFIADINPTFAMDPNAKASVMVERDHWIEKAQVMHIDGRHFAHRNFLGTLEFKSDDSEASWPIMNVDPKKIESNRNYTSSVVENWETLTSQERYTARRGSGNRRLVPYPRSESFLVKKQGVLDRQDNVFIEVKKNDDGKWVAIN